MSSETKDLIINCDADAASSLASEINGIPGGTSRVIERKNLDGSMAGWIVFATLAIRTLPQVLDSIAKIIEISRVRSIKVGDIQIENPSSADVEDLKKLFKPPTAASN